MRQCFLDMDGVLADFVGGVCEAHGRPNPYTEHRNFGNFDMHEIWRMTPGEFWSEIDRHGAEFWARLGKTPEADSIVKEATRKFGAENIAILTSPSFDPGCVPGKRQWIRRNYPQFAKNIIFGGAKGFLAAPGKVLIDDRDKNIDDFRSHGGTGILVPRPWNSEHHDRDNALSRIMGQLAVLDR